MVYTKEELDWLNGAEERSAAIPAGPVNTGDPNVIVKPVAYHVSAPDGEHAMPGWYVAYVDDDGKPITIYCHTWRVVEDLMELFEPEGEGDSE